MSRKIFIINGPNLNLLGEREPGIYGSTSYEGLVAKIKEEAKALGFEAECFQSNIEGELINEIQRARKEASGVIINPGGYTHTSVAIRDALSALAIPIVEIHISNIFKREEFRHHSHVSAVATGVISGLGVDGYLLALDFLARQKI